jgi:hypothetical protein
MANTIWNAESPTLSSVCVDNPTAIGKSWNGVKLHFMLIQHAVNIPSRLCVAESLLLLSTGIQGHFERVRLFKLSQPSEMEVLLGQFVSASTVNWLEYEEFDGDRYIITIA